MHMHTRGLYLLLEVVKLKNLVGIQITDDPMTPRAFPRLAEIKQITKDIPLYVYCTLKEFVEGLQNQTLIGGVMYFVRGVPTMRYANELMEQVKQYNYTGE